jgi:hypothetical protein
MQDNVGTCPVERAQKRLLHFAKAHRQDMEIQRNAQPGKASGMMGAQLRQDRERWIARRAGKGPKGSHQHMHHGQTPIFAGMRPNPDTFTCTTRIIESSL